MQPTHISVLLMMVITLNLLRKFFDESVLYMEGCIGSSFVHDGDEEQQFDINITICEIIFALMFLYGMYKCDGNIIKGREDERPIF